MDDVLEALGCKVHDLLIEAIERETAGGIYVDGKVATVTIDRDDRSVSVRVEEVELKYSFCWDECFDAWRIAR